MRKSEISNRVQRAAVDLESIRQQMPDAIRRLDEYAANGFANSAGDQGGGGRASLPSSPVERVLSQPDDAARFRQRLEQRLVELGRVLDEILAVQRWATVPVPPEDGEMEVRWCEVMAGVGVSTPASSHTDVGGRLERKHHLCSWARKFVVRVGRLPSTAEAEAHAQGRDVRVA